MKRSVNPIQKFMYALADDGTDEWRYDSIYEESENKITITNSWQKDNSIDTIISIGDDATEHFTKEEFSLLNLEDYHLMKEKTHDLQLKEFKGTDSIPVYYNGELINTFTMGKPMGEFTYQVIYDEIANRIEALADDEDESRYVVKVTEDNISYIHFNKENIYLFVYKYDKENKCYERKASCEMAIKYNDNNFIPNILRYSIDVTKFFVKDTEFLYNFIYDDDVLIDALNIKEDENICVHCENEEEDITTYRTAYYTPIIFCYDGPKLGKFPAVDTVIKKNSNGAILYVKREIYDNYSIKE